MASDNTVIGKIFGGIKNALIVIFMSLFVMFLGNGLNLMGWAYLVQARYYLIITIASIAIYFLFFIQLRKKYIPFNYYVLFLIVWPTSGFCSSIIKGGNITDDLFLSFLWTAVAAFYLIFHRFHYSEKRILYILGIVALTTVTIQLLQFFEVFPPIFGDPTGEELGEEIVTGERNGILRLFVGCMPLQMMMLFFFWTKFMTTFRLHWAVLTGLLLFSVYIYLTKQVLLSTIVTLGLSIFMIKGRNIKIFSYSIMIVLTFVLMLFWEDLFGEMIKDSKDDSFSHAIRLEFIGFISEYYISHPVESFFGHGWSIPLIKEWIHKLYHLSDIGFFGEAFGFGWPWSLAYFYILFRLLVTYRNRIPLYIKLYLISTAIISIFIFPYRNRIEHFTWISALYISSLYILKGRKEQTSQEELEHNYMKEGAVEVITKIKTTETDKSNEDISNNTNIQE